LIEEVLDSQHSPFSKTPLDGKEFRNERRVAASAT